MSEIENLLRAYPHAVGPEKSVLSTLLQEPEVLNDAPSLTARHFHLPGHRIIFELVRELVTAGKPVELVSFIQFLLDCGKLEAVGGPSAVCDVSGYQPMSHNFQTRIAILNEKIGRRMAVNAGHEMIRAAYESDDITEILEATSAPITAIHDVLTAVSTDGGVRIFV